MSTNVSIKDVAEAAGVSKSTVSRVINGIGKVTRISPATQARVLAVAHQLGYQTNLLAQNISLGKGITRDIPLPEPDGSKELADSIGLILSAASPPDALALVPGLEPILAAAHYRLVVITVLADPAIGQARVNKLLNAGIAGIICCPTVYPVVLKTVAGTRPVIVLWANAARAMMSALPFPQPSPIEDGSAGTPRPTQEIPQGMAEPSSLRSPC